MSAKPKRIDALNYAFPVVIRYCGLVAMLVLIGFSVAGHYLQVAPGIAAATAMILYKTVHDAAQPPEKVEIVAPIEADVDLEASIEEAALRAAKRRRK